MMGLVVVVVVIFLFFRGGRGGGGGDDDVRDDEPSFRSQSFTFLFLDPVGPDRPAFCLLLTLYS